MRDSEYLDGGQLGQILHVLCSNYFSDCETVSGEGAVNTCENLDSVILKSGGGGNISIRFQLLLGKQDRT